MISKVKNKRITWIDLERPSPDEVKDLIVKYGIHPIVADELLHHTIRTKVDIHKNFFYLVLHYPVYDSGNLEYVDCEIDFIVGKDFIISSHFRTVPPMIEMMKIFETDATLKENHMSKNAGIVFFYIIRQMYMFSQKQLDHIQANVESLSEKMFEKRGDYYDLVRRISHRRKDIIDFYRILQLHKEAFSSLEMKTEDLFGKEYKHYLNNMIGEYEKTWKLIENYKYAIESIQQTTDSMLSHRSNEIMKNLSIMAFVTFPLMLIATIFSMNSEYTPVVGSSGDFWIILGLMVLSTVIMFTFFKRKKWL